MAKIIVISGEERQEYELAAFNSIGRHPDNTIQSSIASFPRSTRTSSAVKMESICFVICGPSMGPSFAANASVTTICRMATK
jgi:hypothetical protein